MSRQLYVDIPEYWEQVKYARTVQPPQNFEDLCNRIARKAGLWRIVQLNKHTGEVEIEQWLENVITDNGALALWKNTMNASSAGISVANIIATDQSTGYTTLAASITSGTSPTSIQVGTLTGPTIPNGSTIFIGAGTANTYQCTVNQVGGITGAGTYTVTAGAAATGTISIGANIKVIVGTADASSLSSPVAYTAALPSGQFTISGSGAGNRQMQVSNSGNYLFSTSANSNPSTATAANYTAAWLVNANPVASTSNTFIHVTFDAPIAVSSSSNGQVTIIEKI